MPLQKETVLKERLPPVNLTDGLPPRFWLPDECVFIQSACPDRHRRYMDHVHRATGLTGEVCTAARETCRALPHHGRTPLPSPSTTFPGSSPSLMGTGAWRAPGMSSGLPGLCLLLAARQVRQLQVGGGRPTDSISDRTVPLCGNYLG